MTETKTLASQPKSNSAAVSTPSELNFLEIVQRNARRKVDNGAQFSSTKGKTSLLNCCIDDCRSQLGIAKHDSNNVPLSLPGEVFDKLKQAVESFWYNDARAMVERALANDAQITTRHGILMSRVSDKGDISRSKTDKLTAIYKPKQHEFRLCDTFGLTAAKNRLDTMLEQVGKWSRSELDAQRRKIAILENELAAKQPEVAKQ